MVERIDAPVKRRLLPRMSAKISEFPLGVMTEAVAQGTSQDETPGSGSDATTGFAFPPSASCEVPESTKSSRLGSEADVAELDPTIPEACPVDDLEEGINFDLCPDCLHCRHYSPDQKCSRRGATCPNASSTPETLKLETTGVTRQNPAGKVLFGELWKQATIFKFSVAAKLKEAGMPEKAEVLEDCHSRLIYCQCDGCHSVKIFRNRCDRFYCPECQPKLAKRRAAGVAWWAVELSQPKHVVLTVQNIDQLSRGHVDELKKWFTRLRHRIFAQNWRGGFYSVEVTNEGRGWHLHLHALVDARWIDAGELARQWYSVTNGFGKIVKVKDCRRHDYLAEVTKYAVKGSELAGWTPSQIADFIRAFDGVRTFGVFGSLYGKRTEFREWLDSIRDHKPLCECGCVKMRYYSEADWLARDFRPTTDSPDVPAPPAAHPEFGFATPVPKSHNPPR